MEQAKTTSPERQKSAVKTSAILDGAMLEFLAHGYTATSMDRIAVAAGVSKATVYSHFQDKESLFIALIQQLVQKKFQAIFSLQPSQTLQGEPSLVLRRLANNMLDGAASDREFLNFMRLILGESGRFPELARAFVQNIEKSTFRLLCQYLASCPNLKLADPEATARIFIGALVHFIIVQNMMHGKDILPMERDRLVNSLVDLIVEK